MIVVTLHLTTDSGESASNLYRTVVNLHVRERTLAGLPLSMLLTGIMYNQQKKTKVIRIKNHYN